MASRFSNTSKLWLRHAGITGFLLCLLLAPACSMRQVLLDNHEWLAGRMAVRYLDLDRKQRDLFADRLRSFSRKLSESAVDDLAGLIEAAGSSADPSAVTEQIQVKLRGAMVDACDAFAPVMAALEPGQIGLLKEKIEERNGEHDPDKNGGLARFRRKTLESLFDSMDRWTGALTQQQREIVVQIDQEKDGDGKWERDYIAYSREAQAAFVSLLVRNRGNVQAMAGDCRAYASNPDAALGPSALDTKSRLRTMRRKVMSALHASLDDRQRAHLVRETANLAGDLRAWARGIREGLSP